MQHRGVRRRRPRQDEAAVAALHPGHQRPRLRRRLPRRRATRGGQNGSFQTRRRAEGRDGGVRAGRHGQQAGHRRGGGVGVVGGVLGGEVAEDDEGEGVRHVGEERPGAEGGVQVAGEEQKVQQRVKMSGGRK